MNARRRKWLVPNLRPSLTGGLWLRLLMATASIGTATAIAATWAVNYSGVPLLGKGATSPGEPAPSARKPVYAPLPVRPLSYLGVYDPGAPRTYTPVASFSTATGQHIRLVLYYSGWGEPFMSSFADAASAHGTIPLVQIDPDTATLASIAAGRQDPYLQAFADSVRDYGHAVVIGFGHEMNGPWYPWGYKNTSPAVFVATWRHVVDVFRAEGADNVTWLWTVNRDGSRTGPIKDWWPGSAYVTWVGITGYYTAPWDTFRTVFGGTIGHVRRITRKPILLAENAVGPLAGQVRGIYDLFAGVRRNHLLGLVWFDEAQNKGVRHQDWRLEDSPAALAAFRKAAAGYPRAKR